jgi:hypothetical protein
MIGLIRPIDTRAYEWKTSRLFVVHVARLRCKRRHLWPRSGTRHKTHGRITIGRTFAFGCLAAVESVEVSA